MFICVCITLLCVHLKPMDTENDSDVRPRSSRPNTQTIPELEVYLNLLVLLLLIDHNKLDQVCNVCACVCLFVCLSACVCVSGLGSNTCGSI